MDIIKKKLPVFFILLVFMLSIIMIVPGALLAEEEDAEVTEEVIEPEPDPIPETLTFDITYPEVQGKGVDAYEFSFELTYDAGNEPFGLEEEVLDKVFDIQVDYPEGWFAATTPQYETTTEILAVKLTSGKAVTIRVVAAPLIEQEPGEYPISVTLKSNIEDDPLEGTAEYKAIIIGTYELDLKTKSGRLSTDISSGQDNNYTLTLENLGSDSIENISLTASKPSGWKVKFDEDEIEVLEASEKIEIDAIISPPDKTLAGDYVLNFNVNSENSTDSIELRVTVETPTIWGIVGIAVIVLVVIGIAIVFSRLGRR